MKNRYEKFVLEAEKGIKFDVSDGENGELIIRALMVDKSVTSDVVKKEARNLQPENSGLNYQNPPIPYGYRYVCGEWNNGFVIERCSDGSQFVWIPVGFLPANGTIDGKTFNKKFGRRNYLNDKFTLADDDIFVGYREPDTFELSMQIRSVKKYGGFYFSRYYISINDETGEPQSKNDGFPLTSKYDRASSIANSFEASSSIKSHILFGAEYDSVLEWFIASNVKTLQEIVGMTEIEERFVKDYLQKENREKHKINNIYDFDLCRVWTKERCHECLGPRLFRVIRGGFLSNAPIAKRQEHEANATEVHSTYYNTVAFRVALWID